MIAAHTAEIAAAEAAVNVDGAMAKVSELLLAFPSAAIGEAGAKAKARGYMTALDDMPAWAVAEACRRWLRAECGDRNYDFAPSAPVLRKIAEDVMAKVRGRRVALERLLSAEVDPEYSPEHCDTMRQRIAALFGFRQLPAPEAAE